MFLKNLFKSDDKSTPHNDERMLYPILPAEKLLDEKRRGLVEHLRNLITAPEGYFESFYLQLIHNFTEFAQLLPFTDVGPLAEILDQGLQHAVIAVQVYKENPLKNSDPLLLYALFSGVLLANIDKVCQFKKVIISDVTGIAIKEWLPFEGSMIGHGEYYRIRSYRTVFPTSIKLMLAQKLIPEQAFLWLTSEPKIFRLWLAIILHHEDDEATRDVKNILSLIKEKIDELIKSGEQLPATWVKPIEPTGTVIGEEFLQWLKDGLHDKSISVNNEDSKVHILQEGAIITHPDLFKEFAEAFKYSDWVVVQAQFNYLGLTKLSGYDKKIEKFFSESPEAAAKKFTTFTANKQSYTSQLRTGVLLASEWLYTSPNAAAPVISSTAALLQRDLTSKKRMWPQVSPTGTPLPQPKSKS